MTTIYLGAAQVDDEDMERVQRHHWHVSLNGYAVRDAAQGEAMVSMHRWLMDAPIGVVVDHVNGDKLDNRKQNLRLCTVAENNRNRPKTRRRAGARSPMTAFLGVQWCSSGKRRARWEARVKVGGKCVTVGRFNSDVEAAKARDAAAVAAYGEFANLNFAPA